MIPPSCLMHTGKGSGISLARNKWVRSWMDGWMDFVFIVFHDLKLSDAKSGCPTLNIPTIFWRFCPTSITCNKEIWGNEDTHWQTSQDLSNDILRWLKYYITHKYIIQQLPDQIRSSQTWHSCAALVHSRTPDWMKAGSRTQDWSKTGSRTHY